MPAMALHRLAIGARRYADGPSFADAVGYPLACAKGVKSMIVHSLSVKQVA